MKKLVVFALIALLSLAMVFAAGSSEKSEMNKLEKIKAAGKLVVGTEAQYAPYEFKDANANFVGCDIWLAQQIADSIGVKLEIVDMSFDGIISSSYETSTQYLVVKAGNENVYTTKASLKGQKIGAQKGTNQSQIVMNGFPESELFELAKYPALALEVQNGNIAGLVADQAAGESIIESSEGKLVKANFTFDPEDGAVGTKNAVIQKGNPELVAAVNEVIDRVVADGSFLEEFNKAVELAATLGL